MSLFDLLLQPRKKRSLAGERDDAKVVRSHHVVEAPLKSFVANGRRRKGISSFKKKILLERLAHHRRPQPFSPHDDVDARQVRLLGFVDEAALLDQDELEELLHNAEELLAPFDGLEKVSVQGCDVLAVFNSSNAARVASATLRDLVVGGESLRVDSPPNAAADSSETPVINCTLRLSNLVSKEDVEDEESAAEVLSDLAALMGGRDFSRLWLEPAQSETHDEVTPQGRGMCSCERVLPVMVLLSLRVKDSASLQLMSEFDSSVGLYSPYAMMNHQYDKQYSIEIRDKSADVFVCLVGFTQADQLDDEDEREELIQNVISLCSPFTVGSVLFQPGRNEGECDALISTPSCANALRLIVSLMGRCVGGETLVVELRLTRNFPMTLFSSQDNVLVLSQLVETNVTGPLDVKASSLKWLRGYFPDCFVSRVVSLHDRQPPCESLCSFNNYGSPLEVCVGFPNVLSAEGTLLEMDGKVIGGAVIGANSTISPNLISQFIMKDSCSAGLPASSFEASHSPTQTKYAEARLMPKLPPHDQPPDSLHYLPLKVILMSLPYDFKFVSELPRTWNSI